MYYKYIVCMLNGIIVNIKNNKDKLDNDIDIIS